LELIAKKRGINLLHIRSKDCNDDETFEIPAAKIVIKKISGVLHFTANEALKPSFDVLASILCEDMRCLIDNVEKRFKPDIATWITSRLTILNQFIYGDNIRIPLCLKNYDEIVKRLVLGVTYVVRPYISVPYLIDDTAALIVNLLYEEAYVGMMRPYWIVRNKYLETREMLTFNPIVIAPGGAGGFYRLARPDRYVVIFDHMRWELDRKAVEKIAYS
jgi:hypothetical protein